MTDAPRLSETSLIATCADCQHEWPAAAYSASVKDVLAQMVANASRCPSCNGPHVFSKTPAKRLREAAEAAARLLKAEFGTIEAAQPEGQATIDLHLALEQEARRG